MSKSNTQPAASANAVNTNAGVPDLKQYAPQKLNVIFDIDECIGLPLKSDRWHLWVEIFKQNNLYLETPVPHVIFPGVVEFIQLLDQMPNTRIGFFNSGSKEKSQIFVEKLLRLALGNQRYELIKSKVVIKSKEDLIWSGGAQASNMYGISQGSHLKDLLKVVDGKSELASTVLVDNSFSYTYVSQAENLLKVPINTGVHIPEMLEGYLTGGKVSEKVFFSSNNIYYAVGLLLSTLELSKTRYCSIVDALFQIQFIKDESSILSNAKKYAISMDEEMKYYDLGLKTLQQINPQLKFLNPKSFLNVARSNPETKTVKTAVSSGALFKSAAVTAVGVFPASAVVLSDSKAVDVSWQTWSIGIKIIEELLWRLHCRIADLKSSLPFPEFIPLYNQTSELFAMFCKDFSSMGNPTNAIKVFLGCIVTAKDNAIEAGPMSPSFLIVDSICGFLKQGLLFLKEAGINSVDENAFKQAYAEICAKNESTYKTHFTK